MEDVPPSYETAITCDYWALVAHYIPSSDLCAASLVSRRWHQIFSPCLWGNPASHFGTENDRVYVALTRFKRTLQRARLSVRQLTHTLHLPPAQSEIYDGPHSNWLRDILEKLPNLQSLVVSQLPFFDHHALVNLRYYSNSQRPSIGSSHPAFSLRLLNASDCPNTTSTSLADALTHFPSLVFLDLSSTMTARDKMVLSNLRHLSDLQVLKMRKTNLRDIDIDILADAVGIRVRSLDIRGNFLTDKSVRTLLNNCFLSSDDNDRLMDARGHSLPDLVVEDWPLGIIRPDPHLLDEFRGEDFNDLLVKRLTKGIVSRLPCEDLPQSGITHLYIADNHLTVESLSSLVKSERLHVLDAGVVNTAKVLARPRAVSLSSMGSKDREIALPGVEKLTPVLKAHASRNLTYLRMSHVVVTQKAPSLGKQPPSAAHELSSDNQKFELDATEPVFELAAEASNPRYELPGDSIHVVLSPAINEKPSLSFEEQSRAYVRRGSAFAPEAVNLDESEDDQTPVLTATGLGRMAQAINGINSPTDAEPIGLIAQKPLAINEVPELSITLIEEQRRALRSRMRERHGLLPGMLPNLRTLVLVGVPCYDDSYRVIDTLIHFIRDCAAETELADIQASLQPKILHLPGRTQSTQSGRLSEIFALRCIVLEMAPPNSSLRRETNFTPQASKFAHRTKSSTEDMDSEAFWSASTNDFSFFDKEEECGLPAKEPILHFPLSTLSEKMALSVNSLESESAPILQQSRNGENEVDVVKELSKFRRGRKAAYENAIKAGRKHAEGYWSGEVKIVRWQGGDGYRHGSVACYGNVYENGMYR